MTASQAAGTSAAGDAAGTSRRVLAARALAAVTLLLVAGCMTAGWRAADQEGAQSAAWVRALPRGDRGLPVFAVREVPEAFLQFATGRIPPHDPVEYVAPGVELCRAGGTSARFWGLLYWVQYRLAPRPTVCGTHARWRIYLNFPVPATVAPRDRWSPTLAVVRVGAG